jgi:tetratricopeptide (TPR) repeat protein
MTRQLTTVLGLALLLLASPASAQQAEDEHVAQGNYLFKAGYYLKASEHYRLALLDDPGSSEKKLLFGHSLFAIGNYSYASYALRRGIAELHAAQQPYEANVTEQFPSRRAFIQALRDLKRYVTYSPRDPAGLTVLGYVLFGVRGEERRCRDMFLYLQRIDPNDPFAAFFLRQIRERARFPQGPATALDPSEARSESEDRGALPQPPVEATPEPKRTPPPQPVAEVPPAPPAPAKKPEAPPVAKVVPAPKQQGEKVGEAEWPKPVPALSD